MWATFKGYDEIVSQLLKPGASIDTKDKASQKKFLVSFLSPPYFILRMTEVSAPLVSLYFSLVRQSNILMITLSFPPSPSSSINIFECTPGVRLLIFTICKLYGEAIYYLHGYFITPFVPVYPLA